MKITKDSYIKIFGVVLLGLYFLYVINNPQDFHFINGVNLMIHEAGHTLFMVFGEFIYFLGGSLLQIVIPLIFATYFFLKRDIYACGIITMWVGQNIVEVARYAGDAIVMQIPLLGGENSIHDWNWILSTTNTLKYTSIIGSTFYGLGVCVLFSGIVIAFVYIFRKQN